MSLGLALYYASLGLNFAWTPLFFLYKKVSCRVCSNYQKLITLPRQPGLALVDITALTGTVIYLTVCEIYYLLKASHLSHLALQSVLHGPTDGKSSYYLVPYCAWLGVATYLNAGMWWLNKDRNLAKID